MTEKWIQYYNYVLDNYGLKYMYFVRVSSPNDIVYIADGKPQDGKRDGIMYRFSGDVDHYDEPLSKSNPVIWKLWNSGDKADIECELSNTEYGYTYRLWCPVVIDGKVAGLLGANIDVPQVDAEIRIYASNRALVLLVFCGTAYGYPNLLKKDHRIKNCKSGPGCHAVQQDQES